MLKNLFLAFIIAVFNFLPLLAQDISSPDITTAEIKKHIYYLASDELKGRYTGSEECLTAAHYIENQFKSYGLKPGFDDSYLQEFPFVAGVKLTKNNSLEFLAGNKKITPKINDDYTTLSFSGKTNIDNKLVFAGYGISAPDIDYDDYAGLDVKGKVVLVLRDHPEMNIPHSKFDKYAPLRKKSVVARDKGASAIIFVNRFDPNNDKNELLTLKYDQAGAMDDFGVLNMRREIAEKLFRSQSNNLKDYQKLIDDSLKPASFIFKNLNVRLSTEVHEIEKLSWNVCGYIEGNDPELKNQYLIIGAHFDHLGMGDQNSLYTGTEPQIHNGADDNASGTTGVLELAQKIASEKDKLKRTVVFVTFSGEEEGLLGSAYFVDHMPFPAENTDAMINMDMIGRLRDKSLIVYGTGTSSNWKDILNKDNADSLTLTFNDEGYGPSDQSSFYAKKIPVLFFFTGTHEDYHKPSDDADKINFDGEKEVLDYVYDVFNSIDDTKEKPDYLLVERKEPEKMPSRKVWVGTIPDFAGNVDGYKISGVSEGGPAETAGLQGGDIIIKFGDKKISNIYDFTYALADYVPGDIVEVVVKRGDEEKTFQIKLGTR
ncbi:M20/M25/M40 family metallo-hydrolase [bacterium BMS3Abin03]|nr:M20/M25/M40 family metallo-hydrolase [bacterium BMS3Abin03]MCG6960162.1 M20/M25/M40 family metallo-hydrolase [bacterium BMS3Abin03]